MSNNQVLASLPKEVSKAVLTCTQNHLQSGDGEYGMQVFESNDSDGDLELYCQYLDDETQVMTSGVKITVSWQMD